MDLSGGCRIYLFVLFNLFLIEGVWGTSVNVGSGISTTEGSTVFLRCSFSKSIASVDSPPIVHWSILDADGYPTPILTRTNGETRTEPPYRARFSISGEADLRITNVQAEDNGKYRCRVQIIDDIPSEDFGDITLKVFWISKVVSTVPSTGIIIGNTVTMTCTVTGDLTPSVYWKKDDKELKLTSTGHVIKDDHSLVIHSVSRDDDGIYVCGARNNVREEMSTPKRLEVYYAPVISDISDTKTVINQNVTVTFEVDSNPPAILEWTKDGQPVEDINNPSFTFFVPEQEVGKSYEITLTATNSVGKMKKTTKVIIGDACGYTTISHEGSGRMLEAKTLSLKEGRSVTLVCSVKDCESSDTYSYEWYKNDVKYSTSDKLVINDASLMDDNMQYMCRVRGGIPFPSSVGFRIHIKVPLLEPMTIVIICGCAAGFIFLIILIICCVCFCKKRRQTRGYKSADSKYSMQSGFSYNDIEFIGIKERRDDSSSTTSGVTTSVLA
ncbi:hemicentin-1-like [Anneissia japonica]|uniref:hemicentin-1-like n=1 Tax=Anneissia japonica TaxID=1529436 RepID=UPI0014256AD9|nr:hemicentin-1-like [Anneissia japonica]